MTTKEIITYVLFLTASAAWFFYMGRSDALDKAMDAELYRQRLSVYCQQPGSIETLCNNLKARQ